MVSQLAYITIDIVDIFHIVDGKMVEHFNGVNDEMDFRKQLGLIEYTEKGKKLFPEDVS